MPRLTLLLFLWSASGHGAQAAGAGDWEHLYTIQDVDSSEVELFAFGADPADATRVLTLEAIAQNDLQLNLRSYVGDQPTGVQLIDRGAVFGIGGAREINESEVIVPYVKDFVAGLTAIHIQTTNRATQPVMSENVSRPGASGTDESASIIHDDITTALIYYSNGSLQCASYNATTRTLGNGVTVVTGAGGPFSGYSVPRCHRSWCYHQQANGNHYLSRINPASCTATQNVHLDNGIVPTGFERPRDPRVRVLGNYAYVSALTNRAMNYYAYNIQTGITQRQTYPTVNGTIYTYRGSAISVGQCNSRWVSKGGNYFRSSVGGARWLQVTGPAGCGAAGGPTSSWSRRQLYLRYASSRFFTACQNNQGRTVISRRLIDRITASGFGGGDDQLITSSCEDTLFGTN